MKLVIFIHLLLIYNIQGFAQFGNLNIYIGKSIGSLFEDETDDNYLRFRANDLSNKRGKLLYHFIVKYNKNENFSFDFGMGREFYNYLNIADNSYQDIIYPDNTILSRYLEFYTLRGNYYLVHDKNSQFYFSSGLTLNKWTEYTFTGYEDIHRFIEKPRETIQSVSMGVNFGFGFEIKLLKYLKLSIRPNYTLNTTKPHHRRNFEIGLGIPINIYNPKKLNIKDSPNLRSNK